MQCLSDWVAVRVDRAKEKSDGGIVLPERAQEKSWRGEVVYVGPGRTENGLLVESALGPGDRVLFHAHAGFDVEQADGSGGADQKLRFLRESEVIAVLAGAGVAS